MALKTSLTIFQNSKRKIEFAPLLKKRLSPRLFDRTLVINCTNLSTQKTLPFDIVFCRSETHRLMRYCTVQFSRSEPVCHTTLSGSFDRIFVLGRSGHVGYNIAGG